MSVIVLTVLPLVLLPVVSLLWINVIIALKYQIYLEKKNSNLNLVYVRKNRYGIIKLLTENNKKKSSKIKKIDTATIQNDGINCNNSENYKDNYGKIKIRKSY